MPRRDTHFCSKWFHKLDSTQKPCSRWLKQGKTAGTFLCIVCNETKSCKNGGWSDVYKHSQRPKHLQRLKDVVESGQLLITTTAVQVNTTHERALTFDETVTRAETFWALATAKLSLSYNASQHLPELFAQMFSDSNIAKELSLKPRKLSYILSHGTGHYFTRTMLHDLSKAPAFTLLFDETMIVGVRKQLDLHFRYWCERKQRIVVRYYKSIFLGHATADIVFEKMIDALRADGIDMTKMLMLGRDNPNVNKAVEKRMDQYVRDQRDKQCVSARRTLVTAHFAFSGIRSSSTKLSSVGLVDIGPCPLHLIHNSFKIGIDSVDWPMEEFLHSLVFWFSRSPCRRADYLHVAKTLSNKTGKFIRRFVVTRWLDVGPIIERVVEQWPHLNEYFHRFIPRNNKPLTNNARYVQITTVLQAQFTFIRLHFLIFLHRHVYRKILLWYQQTQPLIHLLHDECEQLVRRLFSCFVDDGLLKGKSLGELMRIPFHDQTSQKQDSKILIGEVALQCVRDLPRAACKEFFLDIRRIYCSIADELLRTLPLNNDLLRHLQCLHPFMRHSDSSHTSIMNVARSFPSIILPNDIDRISAEWYVYQNEKVPDEWFVTPHGYHSIDSYWQNIFSLKTNSGAEKFVGLSKLVKCALALSHGNADVERGFSENGLLLSDDRSLLGHASINGLRATRDAVRFFGNGQPHQVPITKDLLDSVRAAHARYCADLNERKSHGESSTTTKRKAEETTDDKENDEQPFLCKDLTSIQRLLDEGTECLSKAISTKDFQAMETAQSLLRDGNKQLAVTNSQILANSNRLNQWRKKHKS